MKEQKRSRSSRACGQLVSRAQNLDNLRKLAGFWAVKSNCPQALKKWEKNPFKIANGLPLYPMPKCIVPKFHLSSGFISHKSLVMIKDGVIGYTEKMFTHQINFQLFGQNRLAITGSKGILSSMLTVDKAFFTPIIYAPLWG